MNKTSGHPPANTYTTEFPISNFLQPIRHPLRALGVSTKPGWWHNKTGKLNNNTTKVAISSRQPNCKKNNHLTKQTQQNMQITNKIAISRQNLNCKKKKDKLMNTTTKFSISSQQKNCRKNIHLTNVTQQNMQPNLPFPRKIKIEKKKTKTDNKNTHYNQIHHFHEKLKFQKEHSLESKKQKKPNIK